jgi:hypothetical protein
LFVLFAIGVVYTSGKFAASVVDTVGNLPPVSLTPVANLPSYLPVANLLPLVSTALAKLVEKFAAGVVDTGGASWLGNISANFQKKSKWS